jgi:hypothetical protein
MSLNEDHGLTPEEEAALNLKDDDEENEHVDPDAEPEAAAAEPAPATQEGGEDVASTGVAANADDSTQPAAEAAPSEVDNQPAAEQPAAKAEVATAPAPVLTVTAPEDAQAKLDKIATDKEALVDKFEAGEITTKDYQKQLDALNDQRADIQHQVREADLARRMNEQQILNLWIADCNKFLGQHDVYKDAAAQSQLDMAIKLIASQQENRQLTNEKALDKAHKMVCAMNGWPVGDEKKDPPAAKVTQHKVPTPPAPPNIGSLPAAAMNDTNGGEFANLDRLAKTDLAGYEAALEGMSEAQRARYLKS